MTDFCFPIYYNIHTIYPEFFNDIVRDGANFVLCTLREKISNAKYAIHNIENIL